MLKISFHGGHSGELCDHALDSKGDLLEAYLQDDFTHLGVTEHLPPEDDAFLYQDELEKGHSADFLSSRFKYYMAGLRYELKQTYGERCQLFIGFETEYYGADPLERLKRAIDQHQPEIIVGSIHHVNDHPIDFSAALYQEAVHTLGGLDELYCRYYDQQYELLKFLATYTPLIPIVVGHMDLVRIFSADHLPSAAVWERIKRNIEHAVQGGLVFEVNSRAFKKGLSEPYPSLALLEEIKARGGTITLGDDSHRASEVGLYYPEMQTVLRQVFDVAVAFEWEDKAYRRVDLPL